MTITQAQTVAWIQSYAQAVEEKVDHLNRLDAAIGDGDFGASIQRGLQSAMELLPTLPEADIGTLLSKIGMKMMSVMGGTSGPLIGTLYIKMGSKAQGKMELSGPEFGDAFKTGVEGVMQLGKAQVGDKTMIDAYAPAAEALVAALNEEVSLAVAVEQAAAAAKTGYENTARIVARKGRASYVGERGLGAIDPGAYAGYMLLKSLADVL